MEPPAAPLDTTPDPAIVQPPGASPPVPPREQQPEQLRIGESGQFSEGLEDRGLLESSTRLKPHEAQSYRKKALWVSWVSIIVTLALAVAAFISLLAADLEQSKGCARLLKENVIIQIPQDSIIYLLGYTQSTVAQDISTLHGKCSIRNICESIIAVSVMRYSASSFGFAFDATLDVLSSAIVLWRYSNAAAVHSAHREYISCPVAYGLVQGTLEPFILPVIFALILIIGIALYYCPVQILRRAIPIATSCRAMFAGKGIGHVCVAAGEMWGVHG
ncbi:hypothetical protein Q9966_015124 [Columba livia]|nr:hypothetical protein Q9966_015124 [Columba livia]